MTTVGIIDDFTLWIEKWFIKPIRNRQNHKKFKENRLSINVPIQFNKAQNIKKNNRISSITTFEYATPLPSRSNSQANRTCLPSSLSIASLKSLDIDPPNPTKQSLEFDNMLYIQLEPCYDDFYISEIKVRR